MRLIVLLLAVTTIGLLRHAPPAVAHTPRTTIQWGDNAVTDSIAFTYVDEDAFIRRLNDPPMLDEAPTVGGAFYRVNSTYWDAILRGARTDKPEAEANATYYPQGGFVKARQGGKDVWMVLDLKQRTILDRYIRLAQARLIRGSAVGILDVLRQTSRDEPVGIDVGGRPMTEAQAFAFWVAYDRNQKATNLEPHVSPHSPDGIWLTFSLPEGRSVPIFYNTTNQTLIDYLGTERYVVSVGLNQAIAAVIAGREAPQIENQAKPGSVVWWPLMIGGGLLALCGALVLSSRRK